jgi:hypothetical protein
MDKGMVFSSSMLGKSSASTGNLSGRFWLFAILGLSGKYTMA